MEAITRPKSLWGGEVGLTAVLAVLALACLSCAAKTIEPAYAFHMALGVIAAAVGIFAIFQRYSASARPSPPLEIDGKPNYNFGPVKFAPWRRCSGAWPAWRWASTSPSNSPIPGSTIAPWFNFGRLRPLHTSAVIFAFGGNVLLATSFYVVQRTCRARLAGDLAPWFVVLGYQFFIVLAGTGYLLGITDGKEYAEPEWYVDLWLTIVWVVYLLVFLGTLLRRKEPHIYVANWFYLAFIVTIAMLHIGNNAAIPVSLLFRPSRYIVWGGVQDAMFQWWYGHNAVGFFLTAGFLGIMYYFVPKRAERPIYSYRLSIVHFWSLIFLYIWAGPHHLHYTALPDWAQTLGMTFSMMLWMPSWGGMINGLLTLSGAWDKLRTDPVLRMLVVSVAFYGMSTFEGPVMSIKTVNSLSHYTDWTDRPRPLGRARLGRLRVVRRDLLSGSVAVEQARPVLAPPRQLALLDRDARHRALHHLDVGVGHPAGPDVALLHAARLPRVLLHRDRRGDASVLRHPRRSAACCSSPAIVLMLYNVWMTIRSGEAARPTPNLPSSPPNEELNDEQRVRTRRSAAGLFAKHHILGEESDPAGDRDPDRRRDRRPRRRSCRSSICRARSRRSTACGPTRRSSWRAATSTSARAAISATAR